MVFGTPECPFHFGVEVSHSVDVGELFVGSILDFGLQLRTHVRLDMRGDLFSGSPLFAQRERG